MPSWEGIVLAGFIALDGTAVGQFMYSRPLVSGLLVGWVLGVPGAGLMIGGALELFALAQLPSGGARLAEPGLATAIAVAAAVGIPEAAQLPLAIGLGLFLSDLAGFTVDRQRAWTGRRWAVIEDAGITAKRVTVFHWTTIGLDFLRGAALFALLVPVGHLILRELAAGWSLGLESTWALVFLGASVQFGVLLKNWGGWARLRWTVLTGAAVGVGLGVWL